MILDEIIQRLGAALDAADKGKGELATALGVTPQTLRNWRDGVNFPNKNRWEKIQEVTKVPLDWLFMGDQQTRATNELEAQLLRFYRGVEERDQENILSMANALYSKAHPEDTQADPFNGVKYTKHKERQSVHESKAHYSIKKVLKFKPKKPRK